MRYDGVDKVEVGKRIRSRRLEVGMEQVELAEIAHVKPHTMWRYENGRSLPGTDKMERIAQALRVSQAWLLRGEERGDGGTVARAGSPAFQRWMETAAPPDLTPEERDALRRLPFRHGPPDPWRYSIVLEQMRAPQEQAADPKASQRRLTRDR